MRRNSLLKDVSLFGTYCENCCPLRRYVGRAWTKLYGSYNFHFVGTSIMSILKIWDELCQISKFPFYFSDRLKEFTFTFTTLIYFKKHYKCGMGSYHKRSFGMILFNLYLKSKLCRPFAFKHVFHWTSLTFAPFQHFPVVAPFPLVDA